MSTSYSPRLVTDGLQLYYDVNNIKSYPGEPTTNAWSNIVAGTNSAVTSGLTFAGKTDVYKLECTSPSTNVTLTNSFTGGVMTLGEYYSISFDYYLPSSNTVLGWLQVLGAATGDGYTNFGTTSTTTDTWLKAEFSVAATVGNDWGFYMYLRGGTIPLGEHAYVTNIQFERSQPHVTQYLPSGTTRSTTDGLKDLSGQANHADLSNATYDSNANLFYDGTGYINFSNAQVVGATEGTISAWVNASNFDANRMTVFSSEIGPAWNNLRCVLFTASNNSLTFSVATGASSISDGCNTGTILSTDTWYYVVGTYDGTYVKIYINGIQKDSYSTSIVPGVFTPTKTVAGWHYSDRYWNGYIDLLKVQNIALTSSQIVNNYNALKGRYI